MIVASEPVAVNVGGTVVSFGHWSPATFVGQRTGPNQLRLSVIYQRCAVNPDTGGTVPIPDVNAPGNRLPYAIPNVYQTGTLAGPTGQSWEYTPAIRARLAAWLAEGEAISDLIATAAGGV